MEVSRFNIKQLAVSGTAVAPTAATILAGTCSTIIPIGEFTSGTMFFPANSPITSITWYASSGGDYTSALSGQNPGVFMPAWDATLAAPVPQVQIVGTISATLGAAIAIPAVLFGAKFLIPYINAGSAGTFDVTLKA